MLAEAELGLTSLMVGTSSELPTNNGKRHSPEQPGQLPLLEARSVTVRYGQRVALDSVDISVRPREIVTVIGLNGAGKSTLLRVLLGVVAPTSGTIRRAPDLRIGYSPQYLNRSATFPLSVRRFLTLGTSPPGATLLDALREVGAEDLVDSQLMELSGGELRRVLLARALLRKPTLLVLDEPLAGVDLISQTELYGLIADIRHTRGCGVLMVSHDLDMVLDMTDTVVFLDRRVCYAGDPNLLDTPNLRRISAGHAGASNGSAASERGLQADAGSAAGETASRG